ncbi:hypothetical protein ACJRO7_006404 [Eucalyptus globulus]|uniref:Uncharacterized protein n=1 Tax=Eucalyptus globulus TaxID=34317 RepID=A0ABD3IIH1_EUCGL
MPVEPWAHPTNQHAARWISGEARPTSFHPSCLNAPVSGSIPRFVNLNQSGSENLRVQVAPVNASAPVCPMNKICDEFNWCGKRFKNVMRKIETLENNMLTHIF